jgi:hypothetical protein
MWPAALLVMGCVLAGWEAAAQPAVDSAEAPAPRADAAPVRDEAAAAAAEPARAGGRPRADTLKPADGEAAGPGDQHAGKEGYLGIVTGVVSDELHAQLELPDDCGLVVRQVVPGSPAEKAGLMANDVLLTFGGRNVTSPLEFTEMVQETRGGTKVRLDIVRRGKRQHVVAVVEAREAGVAADGRPGMPPLARVPLPQQPLFAGPLGHVLAHEWAKAQAQQAQAQAQAQAGPGTRRVQTSTVTINGHTQTTTVASDEMGTIEVLGNDGKRTVSIRGADGKEIFKGPLDGEPDYQAVPEAWRRKVRDLEPRWRATEPAPVRGPGNAT